jgi:dTDP-4-dehydrorhamnose reductase
VAALLHERGLEVLAAHRRASAPAGPEPMAADLHDAAGVARLLDAARPAAVVHAAVLGRADDCEARPGEAERVNAGLPGLLARACRERGLRLVALSTDLVFDGSRPYSTEADAPNPLHVYGRTKRAGEEAVLDAHPEAAVARIALVLGRGHGSRATSSESVLRALRAGRPLSLYTDEYRTPIDPESVADAVARLLEGRGSGLFHLGGPERISRHELGRRVARVFGLPDAGIVAARQADHPGPDRRAPDVSLDSGRAQRELGWKARALDEALAESRA